ncbi:MAG: type II toxin-antitoxin system RelE/ParE family toxin [Acidobacteria bacterium]|nr:type II toxin-antitoxin system RelE/ParE family toxin [Acidobacteriota bacterium]
MILSIYSEAEDEIKAATANYKALQVSLGEAFLDEVEYALDQIQQHPLAWAIYMNDFRRRLLRRFPYGIVYQVEANQIVIVAVMHLHRKPNYWRSRLKH